MFFTKFCSFLYEIFTPELLKYTKNVWGGGGGGVVLRFWDPVPCGR